MFLLIALGCLILSWESVAQHNPKEMGLSVITKEAIQAQLEFLSSDWTEGRGTGEKGIYMAGDYVASMFKYAGTAPAGDLSQYRSRRGAPIQSRRSYFQNFTFLETLPGGSAVLSLVKNNREYHFQDNVDIRIGRASVSSKMNAQVVFVGYGIQSDEFGIDDFSGTDLKGKIALRLSGYPGMNDTTSTIYKKLREDRRAAFQMSRDKNEKLKELGVIAVIEINVHSDVSKYWGSRPEALNMAPNESSWRSDWTRMQLDATDVSQDPVVVSVNRKVTNTILDGSGIDVLKYETDAARGGKFKPVELRGTRIGLEVKVNTRRVRVRNVVAMIEGESRDEIIVVGGHMDHMGMGGGRIWNGADDNGSGTVGVLTLARAFAATGVKPKKTILFCAWTGEEKGLLGSKYFAENPTVGSIDAYKMYLNYDMISRDGADDTTKVKCGYTYTEAYPYLEEVAKKNVEEYGINLDLNFKASERPRGGSDFSSFSAKDVPVISMMAGFPEEDHTTKDETNLTNWDKMLEIIKLGFLNMWDLANNDYE